ncbi:MAG: transcription initiation protein [Gemmatimonadetes bacterium]|nr:transcription initiation protein [Gemmatimonadota bacterium]
MAQFILLLHENVSRFADLTPEEMQQVVARYGAWGRALAEKGKYVGGHKLTDDGGRHMSRAKADIRVTDGPYSEAKEVIGGLFIVDAPDYEAAAALARDCPHLDFGWIEIRQIDRT